LQIKEGMSMDNKYLNKVLDQIVSETTMDYDEERFLPPFTSSPSSLFFLFSFLFPSFIIHCREVYGLNKEEIEYVWNGYRDTIKDRIKNG
tara:strand:+ start:438 stop:707 length:270 start_codon:yes stop_codon:yes gene_type:complete